MKKTIFIAFGAAFLLLIFALGYYFLWPKESGEISVEITGPERVMVGEPFSLEVTYANAGSKSVQDAKLTLYIPEGIAFVGKSQSLRFLQNEAHELGAGALQKESIDLIATGGAETVKHIEAKVSYVAGPNTRVGFETQKGFDVEIGHPAITAVFDLPQKVFSGEQFDGVLTYENALGKDLEGVRLKMDFPAVFQFGKSDPAPSRSNNTWELGTLKVGEKKEIKFTGTALASSESVFEFHAALTANFSGETYPVAEQDAAISVASSPLALSVTVNREGPEYVVHAGTNLKYTLTFKNNSAVTMQNIKISAILTGAMFNFALAKTEAFLDSLSNTFVWNASNISQLKTLEPGKSGSVDLDIAVRNDFPINGLSDKNYTLKLQAQIESPTVPDETGGIKTASVAGIENKVAGLLTVQSMGYFRDGASGVVNNGPFPPRVNQPTQYTVHWILKNYSTDLENVHVSAFLQSNTKFVKVIKSTLGSEPKWNSASGEVTWDIASLPATKGIVGGPIEAVFQIENTPAVNQVNQIVQLVGATHVEARDTFIETQTSASDDALTTALPDDTSVQGTDHDVKP